MRIAITGGTGFVGTHSANRLPEQDTTLFYWLDMLHQILKHSLFPSDPSDVGGCMRRLPLHAVAHCAGINREIGKQTFQRPRRRYLNVVEAAKAAGVSIVQ